MANYCSIETLKRLLPTSITIGVNSTNKPTLQTPSGKESVSPKSAKEFIKLASQDIDSRLSPVYLVPLKKMKYHETELIGSVAKGGTILKVSDHGPFTVGSFVRVSDTKGTELYSVDDVSDDPDNEGEIVITPAAKRAYTASYDPLVSLISYPDPIPLMCARLAVSMMIDRVFVAEQSPSTSDYGKDLRTQVGHDTDLILQGRIRLHGQEHQGSRFGRFSIMNRVTLPGEPYQPGQDMRQ